MIRSALFFLISSLIFLYGCTPKISTVVTMPAHSDEATEINSLVVLPFDGNYGTEASEKMELMLLKAEVKGERYFTLADRKNLQLVLDEQKLQMSGVTDSDSAVQIGRIAGAKGAYLGTANYAKSDSRYRSSRTRCASRDSKGKCVSYTKYTVPCTERIVKVDIAPRLVDIETGTVRYSDSLTQQHVSSVCTDSGRQLESTESLAGKAADAIISRIRMAVAPFEVAVYIEMLDKTDGIDSRDGKNLLKYSIAYAKNKRMDKACTMWEKGADEFPESISFSFNKGICEELNGNLQGALEQYLHADEKNIKPEKIIDKAIQRVKTRIDNDEKLSSQLR